jgi:hypothetical protein
MGIGRRNVRLAVAGMALVAVGCPVWAGATSKDKAKEEVVSPQIVRVSYVEGDVRVSRGKDAAKQTGAEWEKAVSGLPLETGFLLVTGKGRAEVEFEDASTAYLGEDSSLVLTELSAVDGVPTTRLGLISGTMTIDVKLMAPKEVFSVQTLSDDVMAGYPGRTFLRINGYLDSMALTPQETATVRLGAMGIPLRQEQTVVFRKGRRLYGAAVEGLESEAAWDVWVHGRVSARETQMAEAMKASGLTEPVPGLAEMNGQGTFFACEPYGTCWEPTGGWSKEDAGAQGGEEAATRVTQSQWTGQGGLAAAVWRPGIGRWMQAGQIVGPNQILEDDDVFPCSPFRTRTLYQRDASGKYRVLRRYSVWDGRPYPYEWAVCHTGSWIHRGHRYAWVAGTHRHHHCPVRWVKMGGKVGYVPIHPRDVAGKAPLNLKFGMFTPVDRKGSAVERVGYNANDGVKVLREAPKEFRTAVYEPLGQVAAPRMEARPLRETMVAGKDGERVRPAGVVISLDRRTQNLMVSRTVVEGGRTTMVTAPLGSARAGGGGGTGWSGGGMTASRAGASGGGMSSAARGGSSGGGGGFSGGGGASRGSSGGGGMSSSAGASGGGGAASSGGGSHK